MQPKSALLERAIVVCSILLPIFMYPVMLWVVFSAMVFVRGLNEGFTSCIALFQEGSSPRFLVQGAYRLEVSSRLVQREKHLDPSPPIGMRGLCGRNNLQMLAQWSQPGSNRRSLACKAAFRSPGTPSRTHQPPREEPRAVCPPMTLS